MPLRTDKFMAAAVVRLMAEEGPVVDAIKALSSATLQAQRLIMCLCAGPRAIYRLRALPPLAGARLESALDRGSFAAAVRLVPDERDTPATRADIEERLPLPVEMGGLWIGGRAQVVLVAALASRLDALRT